MATSISELLPVIFSVPAGSSPLSSSYCLSFHRQASKSPSLLPSTCSPPHHLSPPPPRASINTSPPKLSVEDATDLLIVKSSGPVPVLCGPLQHLSPSQALSFRHHLCPLLSFYLSFTCSWAVRFRREVSTLFPLPDSFFLGLHNTTSPTGCFPTLLW